MFILDAAGDLAAFGTWVQAIVAMITLFLSISSFLQSKRIKELSQVVNELKKSNEILGKRFAMEKMANLSKSVPVFSIDHINENEELKKLEIFLINSGTPFQHINTDNSSENIAYFSNQNTEGSSRGNPIIGVFFLEWNSSIEYSFTIRTMSSSGFEIEQRFIKTYGERPRIAPPEY